MIVYVAMLRNAKGGGGYLLGLYATQEAARRRCENHATQDDLDVTWEPHLGDVGQIGRTPSGAARYSAIPHTVQED